MGDRFITVAFNQLEDRLVAGGVVVDFQTLPSQFGDNLFDRSRFVQLNQSAAPPAAIRSHRAVQWKQFLTNLRIEQIQIEVFLMKFAHCFFVVKIMRGLVVAVANFHQIGWKLPGLGIPIGQVRLKIAAVAADGFAQLRKPLE